MLVCVFSRVDTVVVVAVGLFVVPASVLVSLVPTQVHELSTRC